ncbi:MAG: ATP-binding protein [Ignavibacteria bacterium]|nr:ATP-binding protein [Ignavibacteria bacterium]
MTTTMTDTYFASPQRSSDEIIQRDRKIIENNPTIIQLLEGFPDLALILNENRQLVAFNSKAVDYIPENLRPCVYGMRPGEAIDCIHSHEMPAGCGTSQFCVECGAVKAIVRTIDKKESAIEECRITRKMNGIEESLDLRVHTSVINIDEKAFTLFSIKDIAAEKRRHAFERIFFHDILNTAGALDGLISLLPDSEGEELVDLETTLPKISTQLINEIIAQRQLLSAETGSLVPEISTLSLNKILNESGVLYTGHEVAKRKTIFVNSVESDIEFKSDKTLLIRSIGNLIKNALEASKPGDGVRVSADFSPKEIFIHVWNSTVMPQNVQLQMFQRSFSTKVSSGHGIGTYSVKLLVEQYLKGKISFVSDEESKTTFTITLQR